MNLAAPPDNGFKPAKIRAAFQDRTFQAGFFGF